MEPWHYSWSRPWHYLDCLGGDRLSALPDRALVRVLSHLPSVEAARTSALSRRWHGVFAGVPVVDLVDEKIKHRRGVDRPTCFDVKVTKAILSRGQGIPIRAFRLLALDPPRILAVAGSLPELRQLVLKGFMASDHAVRSVVVLLVGAWNLEVLSLFPIGPEPSKKSTCYSYDSDSDDEPVNCVVVEEAVDDEWMTKNLWRMHIPCLDYSLRRISIEKFSGNAFDRILAEFLLNKAAALEEFSVKLLAPLSRHREEIAMEFRSMLCNPYAVVTCT